MDFSFLRVTMLTDGIKQLESYQMFIKYYTGQIPPKKSRGKGSQGKKTADTTEETVDVSADDNIIPELDVASELGKSISLTKSAKKEAARQVHATHARIVTEPVPEPSRRRPSGIAFRDTSGDTSSMSKKMSSDPSQKLKGVQTLTPKEQITADTMKALKESKNTSRRQPSTRGSSEGTGVSPGVSDESTTRPNQGKKIKRRRTKESESSMKPSTTKETSKGKASTKSSKTDKSATALEPIKEPIAEVVMDDLCSDCKENMFELIEIIVELFWWKRISEKRTKKQAKTDKTKHGMEKREKTKSNRSQRPKSQSQSQLQKSQQSNSS
ncbi:hypothetical protein Tco_1218600 [Tanacetum coccineum]